MTKEKLEQLAKAKLADKFAAQPENVLERVEVSLYLANNTAAKLNELENACKTVVESMPIYSKRMKENRKWNPSRRYGHGTAFAQLAGIISGIQFSAAEHKAVMLQDTGLSEAFVEQFHDALGQLPYYSEKLDVIDTGRPMDVEKLRGLVMLFERQYNISLDVQLAQSTVDRIYAGALAIAEANKADTERTVRMAARSLEIN